MYHLSVKHKIPLIVSSRISIPNVSPNLTDAHIGPNTSYIYMSSCENPVQRYQVRNCQLIRLTLLTRRRLAVDSHLESSLGTI